MAGVLPAVPNIPPPGPAVDSSGAPKTLRGFASLPVGLAPNALKSLTTRREGDVAVEPKDADDLRGGEDTDALGGEVGVGGVSIEVVKCLGLGGRRPELYE